jgi:hypothetical protein
LHKILAGANGSAAQRNSTAMKSAAKTPKEAKADRQSEEVHRVFPPVERARRRDPMVVTRASAPRRSTRASFARKMLQVGEAGVSKGVAVPGTDAVTDGVGRARNMVTESIAKTVKAASMKKDL